MRKLFLIPLLLLAGSAFGQVQNTFVAQVNVASLPTPSLATGYIYMVRDGSTSTDCVVGGGAFMVFCKSNGTIWQATSSGGGGGGSFDGGIVPNSTFFTPGGYPEYDVQCTGTLAIDTPAVAGAILTAEMTTQGGAVVLNGTGHTCQLDGSEIPIGTYRHNSPLIIEFKGKVQMNVHDPSAFPTNNGAWYIAPTTADAGSNVRFIGIRGGDTITAFGDSAAELDGPPNTGPGNAGVGAIECAGCTGLVIDDLNIVGDNAVPSAVAGATAPVVWFHDFWGTNANCGSPPCGVTQISIINTSISNLWNTATFTAGVPLGFTNSIDRKWGAWSSGTTYTYGDEVTYMGGIYTSIAASNLNHTPTNMTYWNTGRISGFDAHLSALTLSASAESYDGDNFYVRDFGNIVWDGKISWLLNGGIEIEDTGNETGSYSFNNINDEELPANVSMYTFTGQVGAQGPTTVTNMNMSDNVNGGNYVFYARTGVTGCGNVGGPAFSNIVTDVAGSGLYRFFNPAGCQMRTNSTLPEIYSSLSNPLAPYPVPGFGAHYEMRAQTNDLHRNNVPAIVRFPNIVDNYTTAVAQATGAVTITTGIADPYGGTNAFQATPTMAPTGIKFYDHNVTPVAGDVYIGMVAMRANNSDGFNTNQQAILAFANNTGITTAGYLDASQNCTPSTTGTRCDNLEWEWFYTILKVAITDGMAHELIFQNNTNATTGVYQYFAPILVKVPAASRFSDTDVQDYARALTSYPTTCTAGQLCNTSGIVGGSSFNPASPGTIGGTTPDIGIFTNLRLPEQAGAPVGVSGTTSIGSVTGNHWPEFNPNNSAPLRFGGVSGSITAGHCVQFSDTVGTLIDNGTPCGGGGGTVTSAGTSFTGGLISVSGSPVTTSGTAALTVAGTSGGIPYFASGSTWASSAALTANLPVLGGGAGSSPIVGTVSGNTTEFGTVSGSLTSTHCLRVDASGNIVDNGAACSAATVTSVGLSFTGGLISVGSTPVTSSGTIAETVAGTSGGVPYFSSASTWASSGALTANLPVFGGGAGNPPIVGTRSGNTTKVATTTGALTNGDCVSLDASGNFVDSGQSGCGGGGAGGTVTSVGLAGPTGFGISGSPVVTSGTLTFAMPTSWTTGDLLLGNGSNSVARLGIGAASTVLGSNGTTAGWVSIGSGTVTTVGMNNITTGTQNFATCSTATASTTPSITCALANAPAHKFFMNNSSGSAAPDYQSAGEGDLPNTTVFTDTANTFGAHLNDFSAATIKAPQAAGFTTTANSTIGLNTTSNNFQVWANGANKIMGVWTAAPTNGNCVKALVSGTNVLLQDAGAVCGSGSGTVLQTNTVNNTSQTTLNFTDTSGASGIHFTNPGTSVESATIGTTTGAGNAVATMTATGPRAGDYVGYNATPALVNITPGITIPATQTTNFTVAASMRGEVVLVNNSGGATTVTIPQSNSTGFDTNFDFCVQNMGGNAIIFSPTTSTINGAASLTIQGGTSACINSDNTNYFARISGSGQTIAILNQAGVSTANSGTPQNLIASLPFTGNYDVYEYLSESAGCTLVGGGTLSSVFTWTDATAARTATDTFTPDLTSGTQDYSINRVNFWGTAGSAVTITNTYTACTTGTWTYDIHAFLVHN